MSTTTSLYAAGVRVGVFGDTVVVACEETLDWPCWPDAPMHARLQSRRGDVWFRLDYDDRDIGEHRVLQCGGPDTDDGTPLPFEAEVSEGRVDSRTDELRAAAHEWVFGIRGDGSFSWDGPSWEDQIVHEFVLAPDSDSGASSPAVALSANGLPIVELPDPVTIEARCRELSASSPIHELTENGPLLSCHSFVGDQLWLVRHDDGRALVLTYQGIGCYHTYFREAARYFGEAETDLLLDAPAWWDHDLDEYLDGLRGERVEREGDGLAGAGHVVAKIACLVGLVLTVGAILVWAARSAQSD